MTMLTGVSRAFSDDIAIDLGTANTLVHVVGRGIIIDEPSAVAVQMRGGERVILAVGSRAKAMYGKTPEQIELVRPLRDGVIAEGRLYGLHIKQNHPGKKIGILYQQDDYGKDYLYGVRYALGPTYVRNNVVATEDYPVGATSLTSQMARIR